MEILKEWYLGSPGGYHDGQKWLGHTVAELDEYGADFIAVPTEIPEIVKEFAKKHALSPKWMVSFSYSVKAAAKSVGLKNSVSISNACSGKQITSAGYTWKYV